MNWGTPTSRAASRPCSSRIVALRSFDWLRIGVVAVSDTCVAISNAIVSNAPRMTSAVTGSILGFAARFGFVVVLVGIYFVLPLDRGVRSLVWFHTSLVTSELPPRAPHMRAEFVELHGPSRRHHDGGEPLLHDGRAGQLLACAELRAVVDGGLAELSVEEGVAL